MGTAPTCVLDPLHAAYARLYGGATRAQLPDRKHRWHPPRAATGHERDAASGDRHGAGRNRGAVVSGCIDLLLCGRRTTLANRRVWGREVLGGGRAASLRPRTRRGRTWSTPDRL